MPSYTSPGVYVVEVPSAIKPIAGAGTSTAAFIGVSADITGAWDDTQKEGMPTKPNGDPYTQAAALTPTALNGWTEFTQNFGDFQTTNQYLAQAVFGFFNNGGTRCWVARIVPGGAVGDALPNFENVDEISVIAAPLPPDTTALALNEAQTALVAHCNTMQDRVAILDSLRDITDDKMVITSDAATPGIWRPGTDLNGYGTFYFPWIMVADPLGKPGDRVAVPPSGHLAGIYARSDAQRGVQKAPANEVVLGALDVRYPVSKILQSSLNPDGVNCIRSFNGTIKVYGARTLASDTSGGNAEWTYVNVRRVVNFLRESIDAGTQWVVFEPNAPDLWSKIRRNVGAFLNAQWAAGVLVGATPQQAFYVLCDETNNPPDVQALGQVVAEIGVAVVRPAEFVIFRLSQWAGPGQ